MIIGIIIAVGFLIIFHFMFNSSGSNNEDYKFRIQQLEEKLKEEREERKEYQKEEKLKSARDSAFNYIRDKNLTESEFDQMLDIIYKCKTASECYQVKSEIRTHINSKDRIGDESDEIIY